MKKILIALVLLTIGLVGCKKDETNGIVNTSWTNTQVNDSNGWKFVTQISFLPANAVVVTEKEYDTSNRLSFSERKNATYIYNHPTVTVYFEGAADSDVFTISGKKLIHLGTGLVFDKD